MKRYEYTKILRIIAKREGISIKEVEQEMQRAIDIGFGNPEKNIQREWEKIPYKGDRPSVQEVIEALSNQLREREC